MGSAVDFIRLHPHPIFEVLAYAVGFRLYLWRRRRFGDVVDTQARWSIVAAAILGAVVGSRLLFLMEDPVRTYAHWPEMRYLLSGKTIVGALAGGLIAVELVKRLIGVTRPTGDLFAVPLAIGVAIGRIGCFLAGLSDQTYGLPSSLPWAVDFGDGIPRHPVQLYESAFMLVLAWRLSAMERRPHRQGDVFAWFMIAYMAWRFVVEVLKPRTPIVGDLSGLQLAALLVLGYYAHLMVRRSRAALAEQT